MLAAGAVWFAVVTASALSGTRREFVGVDDASGSLAHLLAFAVLAGVLFTAFAPGRSRWPVAVAVLAVCGAAGVAIELGQLGSGARSTSISDVLFDVVGAWLGVATVIVVASAVGWRALSAGVLGVLVASLVALPFARATDEFDVASLDEPLDCPVRPFDPDPPSRRAVGPFLDYPIDEGEGSVIHERDGRVELSIGRPGETEWTAEGLRLAGEAEIASVGPPGGLVAAVGITDEVSVEAWLVADRLPQMGPARVVTISRGTRTGDVDVHLGIERRGVSMRIRTDCDLFNWTIAEDVLTEDELHHVVATYRPGLVRIHVDGGLVTERRVRVGRLDNWDDGFRLHLGDEAGGGRPFRGTLAGVALFDRALDGATILDRYEAGPQPGAGGG